MDLRERNQKQRTFFNEEIASYDDVHNAYMKTKNAIVDNLDKNVKKVLDLGAGTGLELIYLFELYPDVEVTAIDISEEMLNELNKRDFSNHVTTICGDFFEVDFGKDYDAVISTSALHHFKIEEKKVLYRKIFDCLKDGGQFINCDKIALTKDIQDEQLYELEHFFDKYRHIDIPLTVDNEIEILKENEFKDIIMSNVDRDDYRLIMARK